MVGTPRASSATFPTRDSRRRIFGRAASGYAGWNSARPTSLAFGSRPVTTTRPTCGKSSGSRTINSGGGVSRRARGAEEENEPSRLGRLVCFGAEGAVQFPPPPGGRASWAREPRAPRPRTGVARWSEATSTSLPDAAAHPAHRPCTGTARIGSMSRHCSSVKSMVTTDSGSFGLPENCVMSTKYF